MSNQPPNSPHQNGTAERTWRSLFDMARCLLVGADLPEQLWKYAVLASAHIRNRCYNHRIGPICPTVHVFGTVSYTYIQNKTKFDARAEKGIFVGYNRSSTAFLAYYPHHKSDVSSSLRGLTMLMKVLNCCLILLNQNLKCQYMKMRSPILGVILSKIVSDQNTLMIM